MIEKVLIENGHARTAKAFILYRKQHEEIRNLAALLEAIDLVDDYLSKTDWRVLENANIISKDWYFSIGSFPAIKFLIISLSMLFLLLGIIKLATDKKKID